jgi:adenine-specific DNA glycosylase
VVSRSAENGLEYLLIQRPETGLLAGLWDFPNIALEDPEIDEPLAEEMLSEYLMSLGLNESGKMVKKGSSLHIFTHIRRTSLVYAVHIQNPKLPELQGKWVTEDDITDMALSELGRKVFRMALGVEKKRKPSDGEGKLKIKGRKVVKLEKGQKKLSFAVPQKPTIGP